MFLFIVITLKLPIFEDQRELKRHDMCKSSSQVLNYIDHLLLACSKDECMLVGLDVQVS